MQTRHLSCDRCQQRVALTAVISTTSLTTAPISCGHRVHLVPHVRALFGDLTKFSAVLEAVVSCFINTHI